MLVIWSPSQVRPSLNKTQGITINLLWGRNHHQLRFLGFTKTRDVDHLYILKHIYQKKGNLRITIHQQNHSIREILRLRLGMAEFQKVVSIVEPTVGSRVANSLLHLRMLLEVVSRRWLRSSTSGWLLTGVT